MARFTKHERYLLDRLAFDALADAENFDAIVAHEMGYWKATQQQCDESVSRLQEKLARHVKATNHK